MSKIRQDQTRNKHVTTVTVKVGVSGTHGVFDTCAEELRAAGYSKALKKYLVHGILTMFKIVDILLLLQLNKSWRFLMH